MTFRVNVSVPGRNGGAGTNNYNCNEFFNKMEEGI
jgi:hypothetical protein